MEKEDVVPMDEIVETYERMRDSLGEEVDARVVECACFILIAECNVVLDVKPTEIGEFEEKVRPIVLHYMELFQEKGMRDKKLKK